MPASSGEPLFSARLKLAPADFIVREALGIAFDGQGEHLYVHIRKCGMNTNDVAQLLQRQFQCRSVDIGISGLKDKNAITDQWFSIRTPMSVSDTDLPVCANDASMDMPTGCFAVMDSSRHSRKLRRGAHQHNRFIITLRDVAAHPGLSAGKQAINRSDTLSKHALIASVEERLNAIQAAGFANYFGHQRFGIDGQNVPKAARYFAKPQRKITRAQRSLLISAARSQLFNLVCAERVRLGNWNLPLSGEPMLLDGSHSFFINQPVSLSPDLNHPASRQPAVGKPSASTASSPLCLSQASRAGNVNGTDIPSYRDNATDIDKAARIDKTARIDNASDPGSDSTILQRCSAHDIHPTGPLWGAGDTLACGYCEQFETELLSEHTELMQGLARAGLKQQRRALRAIPEQLKWQWRTEDRLVLSFKLLKGVYATSFLRDFMIQSSVDLPIAKRSE